MNKEPLKKGSPGKPLSHHRRGRVVCGSCFSHFPGQDAQAKAQETVAEGLPLATLGHEVILMPFP